MAEKFDMIGKSKKVQIRFYSVSQHADDDEGGIEVDTQDGEPSESDNAFKNYQFGESAAAAAQFVQQFVVLMDGF